MPQVLMTNEEYYTLNEIYHFLIENREKFSNDLELIGRYVNVLESIAGDDEDEIIS